MIFDGLDEATECTTEEALLWIDDETFECTDEALDSSEETLLLIAEVGIAVGIMVGSFEVRDLRLLGRVGMGTP